MKTKKHEIGEIRLKKRFAVLPQKMDSGQWVWMEGYNIAQQFDEWVYTPDPSVSFTGWVTIFRSVEPINVEDAIEARKKRARAAIKF